MAPPNRRRLGQARPAAELKGGIGGDSGPLIKPRSSEKPAQPSEAE